MGLCLYSAPVSQGQHQSNNSLPMYWEGREPHGQLGGLLQGRRGGEQLPIPALAAALSRASAHSGGSQAAACAPCPASLLQRHGPSVSGSRAARRLVGPWLGSGLLTTSIFSSRNGDTPGTQLLTRGVLENRTGVHRAPSQGLDHHCHVGDLVPGKLLQGCLVARRGIC